MKAGCAWLLCGALIGAPALSQTADEPFGSESQRQQLDELRAIQEQREALLRELQQLREQLAESDARMEATQERVRELEQQQTPSATDKP